MGTNRSKDNGGQRKKLGGIRELRTAAKARMRSKPKAEGQEYLDMWVLARERARWGSLKRQAEKTVEEIEKELKKLQKALSAVEQAEEEAHAPQPAKKGPEKNFGTFRVDY